MIDFTGKIAVITGGSRGIGAASAIMFANAGADVAINYNSNKDAANRVKSSVEEIGKKCFTAKGNFAKSGDVQQFISGVIEQYGKIDILVNNHGIWNDGPITEMTEETWDEMMNVNLKSFYLLCRTVIKEMRKHDGGKIINVSSTAGQRGEAFHSHYAATKGAIIAFTKSLAVELADDNILVNCVAPGWVDTELNDGVFADEVLKKQITEGIPLKRIPPSEDIAGPILFLASDLAQHITGEVINVNGGAVLCG